jgi:type IV secretion system protein VirD4
MTTDRPAAGYNPFPYIIGGLLMAADGALYVASLLVGPRPSPVTPAGLLLATQGGYRPTRPVLVLTAFFLLLLIAAGVAAVMWLSNRRAVGTGTLGNRAARWAKPGELRALRAPEAPADRPGRLPLGYAGNQLLATETNHSALVVGPTGSGKTESFVIQAVIDHLGPAIVTSVKPDVLDATIADRFNLGPVYIYDPTGSTGRQCNTWSPLPQCTDWPGAKLMATWLIEANQPLGAADSAAARFFSSLSRYLVGPLLHAAAHGRGMADVLRWVKSQERKEVEDILTDADADDALADFRSFEGWAKETITGIYATALDLLSVYDDIDVAASADGCEIDARTLLDENGTLYLVSPLHSQGRFGPVFEALIMQIIREAQNRAAAGHPVNPGLLLMLDECGNTAPLRQLPQLAATGRGQYILTASIWHSLGQIEERYGKQLGDSVVTNHRAVLALAGISDLPTLDWFSRLCGDTEVNRTSTTHQAQGGLSTSIGPQSRRLAPVDQLRLLKVGQGLLVYGSTPPTMLRLRRWQPTSTLAGTTSTSWPWRRSGY